MDRTVGTYLEVGGGNVATRPNCKLLTCQLILVAAAPVLQDFYPGEKVRGGHGPPAPPPGLRRPCNGIWLLPGSGGSTPLDDPSSFWYHRPDT